MSVEKGLSISVIDKELRDSQAAPLLTKPFPSYQNIHASHILLSVLRQNCSSTLHLKLRTSLTTLPTGREAQPELN